MMGAVGMQGMAQQRYLWLILAGLSWWTPGLAQEIDTALLLRDRPARFTILDEIADPAERRAFTALFQAADPARKAALAEQFLAAFPQSWLLAQAYEIAAKASLDRDDLPAAVHFGNLSLRLLPENPLLLVPLANAQAKLGLLEEARRSAADALEYLDRFAGPASIPRKKWPEWEQALRASSLYVLGRVAATDGLASQGAERRGLLLAAGSTLEEALSHNPRDPEIAFLLALVRMAEERFEEAAPYLALASREPGPLQQQAAERLRIVHQRAGTSMPFERYAASLPAPRPRPPGSSGPEPAQPEYAGSEACRACHATQHRNWRETGMANMFRDYRPEHVRGDFAPGHVVADERGLPAARPVLEKGRHYLEIRRPDGRWTRYPVDYVIGSKWQQAYATKLPGGKIQVLPVQYSAIEKRWFNYWKLIDPADSARAQITRFHEVVPEATYQFNCAPCHTSQLRLAGGLDTPESAAFREGGINCEMCHGPSAGHVTAMRRSLPYLKAPSEAPVDFKRLSAAEYVRICGQCHMQSALRDPQPGRGINYAERGATFYHSHSSRPYADFSRKAFYKDGRFRETTFIGEALLRSACYRKGQAHCGHCHDPHPPDAAANPVSLKFPDDPDRMCLQCHADLEGGAAGHTRHAAGSEASRCVSCHMPKIMNAVLFKARSHQIGEIPDAAMTARFGREESPNACLDCHQEKDTPWLTEALRDWSRNGARPGEARRADRPVAPSL